MRTVAILWCAMIGIAASTLAYAEEPKFDADDVLKGVPFVREHCDGPGRLLVAVDGQQDCLRFYGKATGVGDPIIYMDGDVVARGTTTKWFVPPFYGNLSPMIMQGEADRLAILSERPFITLARPGTYGSTGHHLDRRRPREVQLVNAAIEALKLKFGWKKLTLSGTSGGGHLVGALIAQRSDVGCAVIASGNVSVRKRFEELGENKDVTGHSDFVDPVDLVADVAKRSKARVLLLTDPQDKVVSATSQAHYFEALRKSGVIVEQRFVVAFEPRRHDLRLPAMIAALTCRAN